MPSPELAGCAEPLVEGNASEWSSAVTDSSSLQVETFTTCGVTAKEHRINDVAQIDYSTPIVVVASYENGVNVLRSMDMPLAVTPRLDGDVLVWNYGECD